MRTRTLGSRYAAAAFAFGSSTMCTDVASRGADVVVETAGRSATGMNALAKASSANTMQDLSM